MHTVLNSIEHKPETVFKHRTYNAKKAGNELGVTELMSHEMVTPIPLSPLIPQCRDNLEEAIKPRPVCMQCSGYDDIS